MLSSIKQLLLPAYVNTVEITLYFLIGLLNVVSINVLVFVGGVSFFSSFIIVLFDTIDLSTTSITLDNVE